MTWENFTRDEFGCKCGCGTNAIDDRLIDVVQSIRSVCGFPFPVTSGYRCPNHPIEKSKTSTGTHALGLAADIGVSHDKALRLVQVAMADGRIMGLGVNQKGSGRFIHLDIAKAAEGRPRPHIWSY